MKQYWQSLNDRERLMLGMASATLIIYLFYMFLFAPLNTAVDEKTERYVSKLQTLQWMEAARKNFKQGPVKSQISNSQLLSLMAQQLKEKELKSFNYQLEQTGSGEIQLSFDEVPVRLLLSWLRNIDKHYQIEVKQMNLEKKDKPGIAKVLLVINSAS